MKGKDEDTRRRLLSSFSIYYIAGIDGDPSAPVERGAIGEGRKGEKRGAICPTAPASFLTAEAGEIKKFGEIAVAGEEGKKEETGKRRVLLHLSHLPLRRRRNR